MKIKIIAVSIVALGFTGSAFAQGYLGAGVVRGSMNVPSLNTSVLGVPVTGSGDNTAETSFKLLGGYDFTPHWAGEIAYNVFGNKYSFNTNIGGTPVSINGARNSSWTFAGIGTLPLSKVFSVFGKLGWAWNHAGGGTATDPVTGTSLSVGSTNRSQPVIGVGANYSFTKNWAARLEYEDFGKFTNDDVWGTGGSGAVKGSALSLSAKYTF